VCELSFGGNKGVSCAAVRCGVHVLSTHRDMVADKHSCCI
jgi:hypothetical protein